MRTIGKPVSLLAVLACLASCSTLEGGSASSLPQMSPLDADPEDFAIAMAVPTGLELREGDAQFDLSWTEQGDRRISATGALWMTNGAFPDGDFPVPARAGQKVVHLKLTESSIAEVRATQARIASRKNEGAEGQGSLSIHLNGGCWLPGARRLETSSGVDVFLRVGEVRHPLHLIRNMDLGQMLRQAGIEAIPACGSKR